MRVDLDDLRPIAHPSCKNHDRSLGMARPRNKRLSPPLALTRSAAPITRATSQWRQSEQLQTRVMSAYVVGLPIMVSLTRRGVKLYTIGRLGHQI